MSDPDRLLDGENPETQSPEDARHWLDIYRELLGFKNDLVETAESRSSGMPTDAQPELDADLGDLESERRRLERRYHFWLQRVAELTR